MKKTIFRTMILTAAALTAAACGSRTGGAQQPDPMMMEEDAVPNVTITSTTYKDVPQTEVYSTTVQAYVVNNVVPQTGSRIKKINVEYLFSPK